MIHGSSLFVSGRSRIGSPVPYCKKQYRAADSSEVQGQLVSGHAECIYDNREGDSAYLKLVKGFENLDHTLGNYYPSRRMRLKIADTECFDGGRAELASRALV